MAAIATGTVATKSTPPTTSRGKNTPTPARLETHAGDREQHADEAEEARAREPVRSQALRDGGKDDEEEIRVTLDALAFGKRESVPVRETLRVAQRNQRFVGDERPVAPRMQAESDGEKRESEGEEATGRHRTRRLLLRAAAMGVGSRSSFRQKPFPIGKATPAAKPSPDAIEEFVATFANSQQSAPASPAGLVERGDPRRS